MTTIKRSKGTTITGYTAAGQLVCEVLSGHWSDVAARAKALRKGAVGCVEVAHTAHSWEDWDIDLNSSYRSTTVRVATLKLDEGGEAARDAAKALRLERGRRNLRAAISAAKAAGALKLAIALARDYRRGIVVHWADR